jgi:hypothetical protein
MTRTLVSAVFACSIVGAFAGVAQAQAEPAPAASRTMGSPSHGPIGLGGIVYLANVPGLSLVYDGGPWHVDTMLGISGTTPNDLQLGGRFWWHLSTAAAADFSAGGGVSYQRLGGQGMMAATNNVFIELGGMIRIFLVQNVALGTAAGVVIGTADASGYSIGPANLVGSASLHYFF